jgi:signal transduction histidine kinase
LQLDPKADSFTIISDPLRLKQIVINMLDNAYKYTHSGEVSFGLTTSGNEFQIFVKDSGIGISPADAERIFERFVQLDSETTNSFGGKGLGLSISRSLAEILGGQIHLESAVHKGTTFYLSLPTKKN